MRYSSGAAFVSSLHSRVYLDQNFPIEGYSPLQRRGTPVLLSASVSDNFGKSPQVAALRRPREIDESTQCFHVGNDNRAIFVLTPNRADVVVDQSDAVTRNAWFLCALCAAISGEISIIIQTGAESWGFPVPRICHWESK